jgi:hypothetical protein
VRSLWSIPVIAVGLVFAALGAVMLLEPQEPEVTMPTYVSGLVIGAGCAVLGLGLAWGGLRMGVYVAPDGVKVRAIFGRATTFGRDEIAGFRLHTEPHHSLPLVQLCPVIVAAEGAEHELTSLATFRALPGARRQANALLRKLSDWTGKPVLSD